MPHQLTPAIVAASATIMATAWYPPAEPSKGALLQADKDALRFVAEWDRLAHLVQTEDDRRAIQPLLEHATMLLDYLTLSPQQSARTAAASLRILVKPKSGYSIAQSEFHYRGFERILKWIDAVAAREGRHS